MHLKHIVPAEYAFLWLNYMDTMDSSTDWKYSSLGLFLHALEFPISIASNVSVQFSVFHVLLHVFQGTSHSKIKDYQAEDQRSISQRTMRKRSRLLLQWLHCRNKRWKYRWSRCRIQFLWGWSIMDNPDGTDLWMQDRFFSRLKYNQIDGIDQVPIPYRT